MFLPNVQGVMFIQGGMFIPDSRVLEISPAGLILEFEMSVFRIVKSTKDISEMKSTYGFELFKNVFRL